MPFYSRFSDRSKESNNTKCDWLPRLASRIEGVRTLNVFRKVDKYGDNSQSPEGRATTVCGGVLTLLFASIVLILIVLNIVRLAQQQRTLTPGDRIHINHEAETFKLAGFIDIHGQSMHFPAMDLVIQSDIYFFESDNPSVQKVSIEDNTNYNPSFSTSSSLFVPPTTRSVYAKVNVLFDSVDDPTGEVSGKFGALQLTSDDLLIQQLPSLFADNVQTIQLLQVQEELEKSTFYPHNISMYVRFLRQQLDQLLDNQLDVSLYNKGELDLGSGYTLVSSPSLANITQMASPFNLLVLRSSLSDDVSGTLNGSLLNWEVKVQYSSNFNYTLTDFYCFSESGNATYTGDSELGNLRDMPFTPVTFALPPSPSDTTLSLVDTSALLALNLSVPFEALIWDRFHIEKITITNIEGSLLSITRTNAWDFNASTQDPNCFTKQPLYFISQMPIPKGWTCPREFYNDLTCDCGCGAFDIDCSQDLNPASARYCAYNDTHTTQYVAPVVAFGVACAGTQSVRIPGDAYLRGFLGNASDLRAAQCPEDEYYGGSAVTLQNGSIVCNAKPTSQIVMYPDSLAVIYQAITPTVYNRYFNASLNIGIYTFEVGAYVLSNNSIYLDNTPSPTPCGQKPNIPSSSIGYLLSSLKFGDNIFLYSSLSSSLSYLPPDGPYTIEILGEQLTVTAVSCPRSSDGMQMVTLQQPPSANLINQIFNVSIFGYVASYTAAGQYVIPVIPTDYINFGYLFCCQDKLHISVGNANVDSYAYSVVNVSINSTRDESCCGTSCLNEPILYLRLNVPLAAAVTLGTQVSSLSLSLSLPLPCVAHESLVEVVMLPLLVAEPTSEENKNIYDPNERKSENFAASLDLEVAMFVVPLKRNFSEISKLCAGIEEINSTGDSDGWVIQQGRTMQVEGCDFSEPSLNDSILCQVIDCVSPSLLPTHKFSLSQTIPANEKWILPKKEIDRLNSPEYLIDVSTIFYFDYSDQDLAVGKQFSKNAPQEGDFDQSYHLMKFSGELDFIGKSFSPFSSPFSNSSTTSDVLLFPANPPVLNFQVELNANKILTNLFLDEFGTKYGVAKAQGWSKKIVDKFPSIVLAWPTTMPLMIRPGYNYTFEASLTIQPVFDVGLMGGYTLTQWVNTSSTSLTVVPAELSNGNLANIRIRISFDSDATTLEYRTVFTFFDFIAAVGAAVALFQIGKYILTVWQALTLFDTGENIRPNPYSTNSISGSVAKNRPENSTVNSL